MPPGCWDWWRGRLQASRASRTSACQRGEPPRGTSALDVVARLPGVDRAREPLDLAGRQAQRLREVAHRRAHLEGGERGHQGAAVAPVALVDARDEHVAHVAREVEVDVRERGELLVQEAPEEQLVLDRVHVREAGQVADDRGHARPAAAAGRQQPAGGLGAADVGRHLTGQLEQVAMEDEEAREPEVADHAQLLVEPGLGLGAHAPAAVALVHARPAELGQASVGGRVLGAGVAVAEVLGEVEPEALGQPHRLGHRVRVLAEALGHPLGRGQHVGGVAAPARLRLVERRAQANRHHRVLERNALERVHVDVPGCHARHPEPLGELAQQAIAAPVVAGEGPLELDAEALRPEGPQQSASDRGGGRVVARLDPARHRAVAGAAGEADEPLGVLLDLAERDARLSVERVLAGACRHVRRVPARSSPPRPAAGAPMGRGDQPAEVRVALARLTEQRQVRAVVERELGSGDRTHPERTQGLRHLHGCRAARRGRSARGRCAPGRRRLPPARPDATPRRGTNRPSDNGARHRA